MKFGSIVYLTTVLLVVYKVVASLSILAMVAFVATLAAIASMLFEWWRNSFFMIVSPPGGRMARLFRVIYGKRIYDRVFREAILDMRQEYFESIESGSRLQAAWVLTRWRFIFIQMIVEHFLASTVGKLLKTTK